MSWSAALPDAASRIPRTAAGRRALHVALLLGGLLVIGLLWAERAHAENGVGAVPEGRAGQAVSGQRLVWAAGDAEETASGESAGTRVKVSPPSSSPRSHSPQRLREQPALSKPPSHPALPDLPVPVGSRALPSLPEHPEHPEHPELPFSPGLPDAPALPVFPGLPQPPALPDAPALPTLPGLPHPPALPDAPALPTLPGLPHPPALPDVPGLPDLSPPPVGDATLPGTPALPTLPASPSRVAPPSRPFPTPVTAEPPPGGVTVPADETGSPRQPGTPGTAAHGNEPHAIHAGPTVPGIHAHHVSHAHHAEHPHHRLGHPGHPGPSPHAGRLAAGHSPGGRPGGVLGNRSMADSGSSRHGDAHAVALSLVAPLTLMPGVRAPALAAGTACGHRDIPLFPG